MPLQRQLTPHCGRVAAMCAARPRPNGAVRLPGLLVQCTRASTTSSRRVRSAHVSKSRPTQWGRRFPELVDNSFWSGLEPVIQVHTSDAPALAHDTTSLHASALTFFAHSDKNGLQTRNRFEAVQLRDMCACHRCRDPDSGQKNFATHEIPEALTIRNFSIEDNNLRLEWESDVPGFSGHDTNISLKRLLKMSRASASFKSPSEIGNPMVSWRAKEMHDAFKRGSNTAAFDAFLKDKATYQRIIHQLWQYGLAFITSVPRDEQSVVTLGETIGPLRDTFYGRTWDVKDKPKAENVAYTSKYLGLHMDLLYMKQPPGLQLLHCLDSSSEGGDSIFADTFKAAEEMFTTRRHLFDVLATFPVTYNYNKGGHWYRDHKPVFEIDHYAQLAAQDTPFNDSSRGKMPPLANVNWSPPFQGEFVIDNGALDHGTQFRLWCKAAKEFDAILNSKRNKFSHRLGPGECVIFNNRRVVHGREAFESQSGAAAARWLKGAYVDMDPLESKMRTDIRGSELGEEYRVPRHSAFSSSAYVRQRLGPESSYFISPMGALVSLSNPDSPEAADE